MRYPPECRGDRASETVQTLLDLRRFRQRWKQLRRMEPGTSAFDFLTTLATGQPLPPLQEQGHEMAV
jgi:hypothetical protein